MRFNFNTIVWLTAILLAGSAAYYSVFGLSKLFSGAAFAIIIVASILEYSKVIVATFIHDHWKSISKTLRAYLVFALGCLMVITSLGIYGFLTAAYQDTVKSFKLKQTEISKIDIKINSFKTQIENKSNRALQLENQLATVQKSRQTQDKIIESLYSNKKYNNTKLLENSIKSSAASISKSENELQEIQQKISNLTDSVSVLEASKIQLESDNTISEIGPLIHIANALSISMESVVNYLVLLIMLVFDPLAIALVFAANTLKHKKNFEIKTNNSILYNITENTEQVQEEHAQEEQVQEEQVQEEQVQEEQAQEEQEEQEEIDTLFNYDNNIYDEPDYKKKFTRVQKIT